MSNKNNRPFQDFKKHQRPDAPAVPVDATLVDDSIREQAELFPVPARIRTVKVSNTSLLNIREQASVTSGIVTVVPSGTAFKALEDLGDWTKVESLDLGKTVVGYALTKYLGAT
jgi:hypothetical protein